ncbi:hypothetical protein [Nonomuraea sp. NPDC002799]
MRVEAHDRALQRGVELLPQLAARGRRLQQGVEDVVQFLRARGGRQAQRHEDRGR